MLMILRILMTLRILRIRSKTVNDLLDRLFEVTKRKKGESLPEPQRIFYNYVSKLGKEYTSPDSIVEHESFFWVLSDGTTVFSGSGGGLHHADGARIAGTKMHEMMHTGALRGTFFDDLGIEVNKGTKISMEQVTAVQYLIEKSGKDLIIDVFEGGLEAKEAFVAWYYIDRPVSNDLLYEILNGSGKVKDFQKTMQEIMDIDREVIEGRILETTKSQQTNFTQAEWEKSITPEEKAAIEYYSETMETSDAVRSGKSPHSKPFFAAINRAPKYRGVVYRGQYLHDSSAINMMTKVGSEFTFSHDGKPSAGSKSHAIAEEFIDDFEGQTAAVFTIEIRTGVDISNLVLDEYKRQEEVIIRSNTKFKVVSAKWKRTPSMRWWVVSVKEI